MPVRLFDVDAGYFSSEDESEASTPGYGMQADSCGNNNFEASYISNTSTPDHGMQTEFNNGLL